MYFLEGDKVRADIVYLAHPRTASMATKQTLSEMGELLQINGHHGVDVDQIPRNAVVFTTIRNPWDIFVSWWFKRDPERSPFYGQPLEDFIPQLIQNNEQYFRHGKLFYLIEYANQILRYEQLQAEFDLLLVKIGYPPKNLILANQSERRKSRDYQKYYTSIAKNLVAEYFASEIERYGYQF